jgi:ribose transport system substrate-binding protein
VIAIVPPAMTSTFYIDIARGARAAADSLGYELKMPAPQNESDYLTQANMVETLASQKTAAIAVCAINPKAISAAVRRANEAKIPVFVFNGLEDLPDPEARVQSCIGYDQHKAGRLCGEFVLDGLKKKFGEARGKVILLEGLPGPHNTLRTAGFLEGLQATNNPAIVVERYPAEWRRDVGRQVLERVLSKDQRVDAIFGCNDGMVQGAALAAQAAGVDALTVGIDGNADTLADVNNGVVTATLAVFPAEIGRITVEVMDRALKGQAVAPKVETPIRLITRDNVRELLQPEGK